MNWRRAIALVAIAALGGPVAEASAQSPPRISKAPKRLALGGQALVTVTLAGRVPRRARVTLALREDDAARPQVIGRGRKGPSRKLRVRLRAPEQVTEGTWQLLACIGRRCSAPARIRLFSDSAFERIDRAKRLSRTQALIYKLQAMLGDRRLPRRFRGPTPVPADNTLLQEAYGSLHGMSPAQRRLVGPYFVPPRFRESHWAPRARGSARAAQDDELDFGQIGCDALDEIGKGHWRGVPTANVVVWFRPGDEQSGAKARQVARWMPHIWKTLVGAFKAPKPDDETGCDPGGDGRFDIYVAPKLPAPDWVDAFAVPLGKGPNCEAKGAWMMVRAASPPADVAHEFMHAIQVGYPGALYPGCRGRKWLLEGMATWAQAFVYPRDRTHHKWKAHIEQPLFSLDSVLDTYDTWPFWYWLDKRDGTGALKRVLEGLATADFPAVLDGVPAGGLDVAFRDYATWAWNEEPPMGEPGFPSMSFAGWNRFTAKPTRVARWRVSEPGSSMIPTSSFRPLTVDFWNIVIENPDLRLIKLTNAVAGKPRAAVVVFLELADGSWRRRDISAQQTLELCRDDPFENVERIVLANIGTAPTGEGVGNAEHKVEAHTVCGVKTIEGSIRGSATSESGFHFTWSGNVTLVRNIGNAPGVTGDYPVDSGHVTYTASGPFEGCHASGVETQNFRPAGTTFSVSPISDPLEPPYSYIGHINSPDFTMRALLTQCDDEPDRNGSATDLVVPAALETGPDEWETADGIVYDGSYSNGTGSEWSWSLRAGRSDPPPPAP